MRKSSILFIILLVISLSLKSLSNARCRLIFDKPLRLSELMHGIFLMKVNFEFYRPSVTDL